MLAMIAALQPLLIGAVLLWSAQGKLLSRYAATGARRSALARLVGDERVVPAYRVLGGVELTLGALLLLPPTLTAEAVAATGLALGFLGYLGYAAKAAPTSSCGCLGARSAPVSWRGFARAGLLVVAGLLAMLAQGSWLTALTGRPLAGTTILLVEAAAVVVLSPELDQAWLVPLRQLRVRLTNPLAGGTGIPLLATVHQLQQSEAYRRVAALISSDVREHWDDDEWRIVCHAARYQGRLATAVFAVPRLRYEPDAVRVAIVDEATGVTLVNVPAVAA
ncbi:hypothetical protein GCM10027290_47480 [Micromonospora sonneratiae]|uniref:MauE/DoxX family redox-associated membrane protein n=1 Tax=Micromonospora sonneratiae TaxID=1184706 RepID=A0ABW3YDP2_9ACTN